MCSLPPSRAPFHHQQLGRETCNEMSKRHTPFDNFRRQSQTVHGTLKSHKGRATHWHQHGCLRLQAKSPYSRSAKSRRWQWSTPRHSALVRVQKPTTAVPDPVTSMEVRRRSLCVPRASVLGTAGLRFPNFLHAPPSAARSHRSCAFGCWAVWFWVGEGRKKSNDFLIDREKRKAQVREPEKLQGDKEERRSPRPSPPPPPPAGRETTWPRRLTARPASRGAPLCS